MPTPPELAQRHADSRLVLVNAAAMAAEDAWAAVDPDRIALSWTQQVPQLLAVTSGAQLAAARDAEPYLDEVLDAEGLSTFDAAPINPRAFVGSSSGVMDLAGMLFQPVIGTLLSVRAGASVDQAMAVGRHQLDTIVRTQVADAGRVADGVALTARPAATGYVRVVVGKTCSRCVLLAGRKYKWNAGFDRHPRCDCVHLPCEIADAGGLVQSPRRIYDRLTPAQRSEAGWTLADQRALAEGADIYQVTNAHRGVYTAGGRRFTREGTTKRGFARSRLGDRKARLTPEQIYREAGDDRDKALRLLYDNGYLAQKPALVVARSMPAPSVAGGGRAAGAAAPAAAVRPVLAAARTTSAVQRVFSEEFGRITGGRTLTSVRFTGSAATAREHAEGLLRGLELFPEANLDIVSAVRLNPGSVEYAFVSGRVLSFNPHWTEAASRSRYLEAVAEDVRTDWHPRGTGSPVGIAAHEFGHVLDLGTLGQARRKEITALLERRAIERDARIAAQKAAGELVDAEDWAAGSGVDGLISREISRYATRNADELVAEAFVDVVMNGPAAAPLSREIFNLIEAEYRRGGRRVGTTVLSASESAPRAVGKAEASDYAARQAAVASVLDSPGVTETRFAGGNMGGAHLVTAPDGRRAVRKDLPREPSFAKHQGDAEVLVSRVHEALGLPSTAAVRHGDEIGMEFITGKPGSDLVRGGDLPAELLDSRDGRVLGLADLLTRSTDRVGGNNWILTPGGRIVGFDHAGAFKSIDREVDRWSGGGSAFARRYVTQGPDRRPVLRDEIDISPDELADVRARIEGLRPEFVAAGRERWHDQMLDSLGQIERRAVPAPVRMPAPAKLSKLTIPKLKEIARERGITVPARAKKADILALLEGPPTAAPLTGAAAVRAAARERNRLIEARGPVEDMLAEVDELLGKKAATNVMLEHLDALVDRVPAADLAALRKAVETGDRAKIRATVTRIGTKNGLKATAPAGRTVTFDPAQHELFGGGEVPAGAKVVVVRRGTTLTINGETITFNRAKVSLVEAPTKRPSLTSLFEDLEAADHSGKVPTERIAAHVDGTYAGLEVRVARVSWARSGPGGGLRFSGTIRDPATGKAVGTFSRAIQRDRDGTLHAVHELLKIKRGYQGSGFQAQFNGNLIDWYRKSGLGYVKVGANIDIGGYAWASAGYDAADAHEALGMFSRVEILLRDIRGEARHAADWLDAARDVPAFTWTGPVVFPPGAPWSAERLRKTFKGLTDEQIAEQLRVGREFVNSLAGKTFGADDFPSFYELSQLGRWPGAGKDDVWIGKQIMLGSAWLGILRL